MAKKVRLSPDVVSRVMSEMGRKGGKAKVPKGFAKKQLSKKQRVEAAKRGAAARWRKKGEK
jgi:hypothetical protein